LQVVVNPVEMQAVAVAELPLQTLFMNAGALHCPGVVSAPFVQLRETHVVLTESARQPPRPSQPPALQLGAEAVHAESAAFTGLLPQMPFPFTLQARQLAHERVLQQTPSTQFPELHWPPDAQVAPLLCKVAQLPPLQ
jgi:hypothetical protein